MPKVYNKHHKNAPKDAVYVGRPSKWGNPFIVGKHGTREECVEGYRKWLTHHENAGFKLWADAEVELKGKNLVCWCAPKPCHADVLLELANAK